ncbi:MAG: beta-ketoacyl synthase N-terminal-like domain-containing protein, partial [Planctomycetia bacterium]|nr:beta-ketoacyl synthase N-terminal-like domain-containing protein [Planctomycetia bacterium]
GRVRDFQPTGFVRNRKSLKVMSRDIQLCVAAATLAMRDAGLDAETTATTSGSRRDPERMGVVCGADLIAADLQELAPPIQKCIDEGWVSLVKWGERAFPEIFPLWMLKYLPNMHACHIAIAQDLRGPNNSVTLGTCSAAAAISEAMSILWRGAADIMLAGAAGNYLHPNCMLPRRLFPLAESRPAQDACRPFDRRRSGAVLGEGAGMFVLERRSHALARGAEILATIVDVTSRFYARTGPDEVEKAGFVSAMRAILKRTGVRPEEIAHVNASAMGLPADDATEAVAIREVLGDVPVTAPKSLFGNLGAAAGAVEMTASLVALRDHIVPPTHGFAQPDPMCPVHVIPGEPEWRPMTSDRPYAISLNHNWTGVVTAILLRREDASGEPL